MTHLSPMHDENVVMLHFTGSLTVKTFNPSKRILLHHRRRRMCLVITIGIIEWFKYIDSFFLLPQHDLTMTFYLNGSSTEKQFNRSHKENSEKKTIA